MAGVIASKREEFEVSRQRWQEEFNKLDNARVDGSPETTIAFEEYSKFLKQAAGEGGTVRT